MLQYITDYTCGIPVATQVREVLDGGGRWIEIKMPGAPEEEIRKLVETIMSLCIEKESFLLLADDADLVKKLNVGGVSLGLKAPVLPSQARVFLGAGAVIGVAAHDFADVAALRSLDVDFVTLTPFHDGGNQLGLDGIKAIVDAMQRENLLFPTVARGNVTFADAEPLLATGVNGLAVGSAIARSGDIASETAKFVELLDRYRRDERKAAGLE